MSSPSTLSKPALDDRLPPGSASDTSGRDGSDAEDILRALHELSPDDPRREELRERIVRIYQPVVNQIARRYSNRGEPFEDLRQTAMVGLMKAIQGFDPYRGKKFISYLLPMVTGEVKRHFRDRTWAIRVPRRHQENRAELNRVTMEFNQRHARAPTVKEVARELGLPVEETLELIDASAAYSALSLDAPYGDSEEATTLEDVLGDVDTALEGVVDREALKPALAGLPARERRILLLRYFGNKTQSDIARQVGCSQMHVSRLLSTTLERLRHEMLADE